MSDKQLDNEERLIELFKRAVDTGKVPCDRVVRLAEPARVVVGRHRAGDNGSKVVGAWVRVDIWVSAAEAKP